MCSLNTPNRNPVWTFTRSESRIHRKLVDFLSDQTWNRKAKNHILFGHKLKLESFKSRLGVWSDQITGRQRKNRSLYFELVWDSELFETWQEFHAKDTINNHYKRSGKAPTHLENDTKRLLSIVQLGNHISDRDVLMIDREWYLIVEREREKRIDYILWERQCTCEAHCSVWERWNHCWKCAIVMNAGTEVSVEFEQLPH